MAARPRTPGTDLPASRGDSSTRALLRLRSRMTARPRRRPFRRPRSAIRVVRSRQALEEVRALFRGYGNWLIEHREVTAFPDSLLEMGLRGLEAEAESLPGSYGPPWGALFLASMEGAPVGCVALRRLGPRLGEIKRLFVRPEGRGLGIGQRLNRAALHRARKLGYSRVVLDTLSTMAPAIALYRAMGFRPIPAYWQNPFPGVLSFEYRLNRPRSG